MLILLLLFTIVTAHEGWKVQQNYIFNTINSPKLEIEGLLQNPGQFKHLPPLITNPQSSQRTLNDGEVPEYCIKYAPLVHLYSEEKYLPYDIAEYVKHFHVEYDNGTTITGTESQMSLAKLALLSEMSQTNDIYMTSNTDFDNDPEWITGVKNKPSLISGETKNAPATVIVVDKGNGWVDAYWFYFYSFNCLH